jgi:hypothetical protein
MYYSLLTFEGAFELLARSLNHQHFAIVNDTILEEAEWREMGAKHPTENKVS